MQGLSHNYLNLLETPKTRFKFRGQDFVVSFAPAPVFDLWARQFYERITGVDPMKWGTPDRWQLINDLLKKGRLLLIRNPEEGTARLVYPDAPEVPGLAADAGSYDTGSSGELEAQTVGSSGDQAPAPEVPPVEAPQDFLGVGSSGDQVEAQGE